MDTTRGQPAATIILEMESEHHGQTQVVRRQREALEALEAAESGESSFVWRADMELSREGLTVESTVTTDSEMEVSRRGDTVGSGTNTTPWSSDDSKKKGYQAQTLDSTATESDESDHLEEAWKAFEKTWKAHVKVTEEEKEKGYRFSREIDPVYLGFYPRKPDKRKYLKAYPIIGTAPEARLGCFQSMPMTFSQWSFVIGFFVIFAGLGTGVYFYMSNRTLGF